MKLPPLTVEVKTLELDDKERDFYEAIYKRTKAKFNAYVTKGTVLHNYMHIFELLSRLRQTCDHPYLVIHREEDDAFGSLPSKSSGGGDVCGICLEDIESKLQANLSSPLRTLKCNRSPHHFQVPMSSLGRTRGSHRRPSPLRPTNICRRCT